MFKRILSLFALVFAVSFLFSSCKSSDFIKPVDSLLTPPLYHEEYKSLVDAFHEKVSKNVVFCSPHKGDYRSAIIIEDLDGDNQKEALIFYRDEVESSVAKLHYFKLVDGSWISRSDFSGYGNEVEKLMISDMDGDGNSELIVIWSVSGVSSSNIMSVYRTAYSLSSYKELSTENCSLCELTDIDGDSKDEIFYISQTTASGVVQRAAKAVRLSDGGIVIMGEAKLDPNISSYTSVKTEKVSGDSPLRIYIDALKGESQMITELIYWDSEKSQLCAPFLDADTMSNIRTLRDNPLPSTDINNDGTIDIPVQSRILNEEDSANKIYVTDWVDFSGEAPVTVASSVVNFADNYMINLSEDEAEEIYVISYREQNCWVVCRINADGTQTELYSVLSVAAERWAEDEFKAYFSVLEYENSIICAYITENGVESGITEDYLKSRITKIPV